MAKVKCPECGAQVEAGYQAFKHAYSCFHLPDIPTRALLEQLHARGDEYARRALELLESREQEE
ncbi:MAG: hypothetical protein QXI60_03375 [Thermofilaceae archaeon]